ncbi:MAG: hypothetical protein LBS20_15490 [Prevotella sp.]|jgi:hypothetical protein|nr:hypothetical protein [Prevotella sp.]
MEKIKKGFIKKYFTLFISVIGLLILICFALLLIPESQMPTLLQSSGLVAIISAFLGVIMTVSVTAILLEKQADIEQTKNKNMKIFEKKQEVYHAFLEKLKEIIQDDEVAIGTVKGQAVDELKDLIFQLGFLQMHQNTKDSMNNILKKMAKIIELMNKYKNSESKNEELEGYYTELSMELFEVVAILRKDLYDEDAKDIKNDKINETRKLIGEVLKKGLCDNTPDTDRNIILADFLHKFYKQFEEKGYPIDLKGATIKHLVEIFYKENHRITLFLEIPEMEIGFEIEINKEGFWYSIPKDEDEEGCNRIIECLKDTPFKKNNKDWIARKESNRKLNFIDCNENLKIPNKRSQIVRELVEEIYEYIIRIKNC